MGRIRTVKPDLFLHDRLFDLEADTGLPVRLAFIGLWCHCDREGRFEWRPRRLKTQVMPFDDIDFDQILRALESAGFVISYAVNGELYGHIPSWKKHQVINQREAQTRIPEPPVIETHVHAQETHVQACASTWGKEGKGKEGNGKGKEGVPSRSRVTDTIEASVGSEMILHGQISKENAPLVNAKGRGNGKPATLVSKLNKRRLELHIAIHGVEPLTNSQTNGMLSNLIKLAGEDLAPKVLDYFYAVPNKFYREKGHPLQLMIHDLEKLATEVKRQAPIMPDIRAKDFETKKHNLALKDQIIREARERGEDV